jgi:glyoxylate/hydroxypyruvate reductase A
MSEYLVAHVINAERGFYPLYNMQRANQWSKGNSYRCLSELTIGILGVGEMGRDAAMRFKVGFGCRTLGLVRSLPRERCPHIDEYFTVSGDGGDDLVRLLKESDYLCSVLPNTAETTGILGGGILKACAGRRTSTSLCISVQHKT